MVKVTFTILFPEEKIWMKITHTSLLQFVLTYNASLSACFLKEEGGHYITTAKNYIFLLTWICSHQHQQYKRKKNCAFTSQTNVPPYCITSDCHPILLCTEYGTQASSEYLLEFCSIMLLQ